MPYANVVANLATTDFRHEELEGRPHLVVPCVMITQNVLEGSEGPIFYPDEESSKNPGAWDHMPLVVDHPQKDGLFVSARQPTFLNTRKVGILLNTNHDNKLKTEAWFDVERTKEIDNRVYEAIMAKKTMEVSTGLGFDLEEKPGEYNGKKYKGVARNYKPDHLAILPDKIGACSVAMGAGLFANAAKEPESSQLVLSRTVENALKPVKVSLASNVLSFDAITRTLGDLLSAKFGERGKYWDGYVCEVYKDFVIYRDGRGGTWSIQYTATDTEVKLDGEPTQVVRVVEYKAVNGKFVANVDGGLTFTKESDMAFDKKACVDKLIANNKAPESDRTKLMATDDSVLQLMEKLSEQPAPTPAPVAAPPTPAVPPVVPVANQSPMMTLKQIVANSDPATQQMFADMEATQKAESTRLIAKIKSVPTNTFSDEVLNGLPVGNLRMIANLIPDPAHHQSYDLNTPLPGAYAGAVGFATPITANDALEEPPQAPELDFATKN